MKLSKRFLFVIHCLWFLVIWLLYVPMAQAAVSLPNGHDRIAINRYAEVLEDVSKTSSLNDVIARADWKSIEKDSFHFGLSSSAWWARVSLKNPTDQTQLLVLDLGTTQQDFVYWYVLAPGAFEPESFGEIGDFVDFRQRDLATRTLAIPLTLESNASRDVYLRLDTSGSAFSIIQLSLAQKEKFLDREAFKDLFVGMFYGGWAFTALFAAVIFVFTRWPPAGFLAFFIFTHGTYFAAFSATDLKYFLPNSPWLHHQLMASSAVMAYVSGNTAAMVLVRVQQHVSKAILYLLALLNLFVLSSWYWIIIKNTRLSELMTFVSGISLIGVTWAVILPFCRGLRSRNVTQPWPVAALV